MLKGANSSEGRTVVRAIRRVAQATGAWRSRGGASLACLLLFAGFLHAPVSVEAQESRSALEGVYSEEQAERGERTFRAFCATCHTESEFHGDHFQRQVGGDSVDRFFDYVRFNMPQDSPGSLSRRNYVDVMAYILKLNGYPAGEEDLPSAAGGLQQIHFSEFDENPGGSR